MAVWERGWGGRFNTAIKKKEKTLNKKQIPIWLPCSLLVELELVP